MYGVQYIAKGFRSRYRREADSPYFGWDIVNVLELQRRRLKHYANPKPEPPEERPVQAKSRNSLLQAAISGS